MKHVKDISEFGSIMDVVNYFKDETFNLQYLAVQRWGDKIQCPHCDCEKTYTFSDKVRYKCSSCRKIFNSKTGTIYQGSKLSLQQWFVLTFEVLCGNGISSYKIAKKIGVTQKVAWARMHDIRNILVNVEASDDSQLTESVQVDETFVGGKNKNRHKDKKVKNSQGRSFKDKTPVLGILSSTGRLICTPILNTQADQIQPLLIRHVESGSMLISDEWLAYRGLEEVFQRAVVDHGAKQYSNEGLSTNGIENFWSIFKRGLTGIYYHVSKFHLNKYVQEYVFRYNNRHLPMSYKMQLVIANSHYGAKKSIN